MHRHTGLPVLMGETHLWCEVLLGEREGFSKDMRSLLLGASFIHLFVIQVVVR